MFADRQLILAGSSLQLTLAVALAEEARHTAGRASWLVFIPDVLDPQLFERALGRSRGLPFERVTTIAARSGSGTGNGTGRKHWSRRDLRRELRRVLDETRPTVVTVFNDRQDAGQILLIEAARRYPQALRECAEDGALAYTAFEYRAHSAFTRWRQRVRFGRGWHDVTVLGTHPWIQQFLAVHPDRVRPELRDRPLRPFPAHRLSSPALQSLARAFCAEANFDAGALPADALLLTLSHSSYALRNPNYVRLMQACVAQAQGQERHILYKYHPRESEPDYLGLRKVGAREVPRIVPVECIYLLARERPLVVVAGMSSALLTAGLLMPLSRIAALVHDSDAGDMWDAELMQALRITALGNESMLTTYLAMPAIQTA